MKISKCELNEINEFVEYVNSFYNINYGLYKLYTPQEISSACTEFINKRKKENKELHYDSLDREEVRIILDPNYSII
jgi:hypothetical protein